MGLKFEPKKFKFGMRTLKTGIAVFLVLGLFSAFGWDGLQIGCLTAVFSLRENFDRSVQFGKSRIFANTVGGLLSLLFYFVNMCTSVVFICREETSTFIFKNTSVADWKIDIFPFTN